MVAPVLRTILLLFVTAAWLSAGTIAFAFTQAPDTFPSGLLSTRGFEFTVDAPLLVTHLGFWDANGDGLANAHEVGIWSSSSILLGSITIPSGTAAGLDGADGFRFVPLAVPLSLRAGTYRIGGLVAYEDADSIARLVGPAGAAGFTTYVGSRLNRASVLSDPTEVSLNEQGMFGPNFIFESAVPEPATLTLWVLGLGLLSISRRRSHTSRH